MPQIKTFCRIKPTQEYYPEFEVSRDTLYLRVPEVLRDFNGTDKPHGGTIAHEFHFDYIFNNSATQEEVFDQAAKEIVEGFLSGYNGTIFAYGQTGTGKTYTVEGSAKSYNQRGLEPRALSMIYKALEGRQDEEVNIHISYLEIYQEVGYDLLNPGARMMNSLVTPFPKVTVLEGNHGVWVVRNLSVHYAASEDVAQSLLLQGQANRRVAATTVHDRSSRSHAIFTVQLSAKQPDSDVIIKSKLHLVDLAGSERVSKTGVQGHLLNEAKSINLSLHFLETVIIALQKGSKGSGSGPPRIGSAGQSRGSNRKNNSLRPSTSDGAARFVPYRNSLLTMVLRDSLGGNCMTAMIATVSLEVANLGESISTCRFAGRVACIANSVSRNEEVDEKTLIRRLRKKVAELETELACYRMAKESPSLNIDEMSAKLTDEDKMLCSRVVHRYIEGELKDPVSAGITSPYKFRECLKILKQMITSGQLALPAPEDTGYHSADEAQTRGRPRERNTRNQRYSNNRQYSQSLSPQKDVQILKVHDDTKRPTIQREKTVDFPIQNAWGAETQTTAPPKPVVKKSPARRQQPIVNSTPEDSFTGLDTRENTDLSDYMEPLQKERTLSEILVGGQRRKYQSPFEKKRVKEIKKLNEKVEKLQQDQLEKEGELVEMKISLAEQELDMLEDQVRNKLNVAKDQVADQHAYVKQLEQTDADPRLIEKERLVESQLKKRQERFDKKLEQIDEKRHHLNTQSEEIQQELKTAPKPSLMDQYGKFRKKDGSLNTKQVFDMLKNEERKQEKVQNNIESEKVWLYNKHLEMKEVATMEKLKQFKEMLRMSQSAKVVSDPADTSRNMQTAPGIIPNGHSDQFVNHSYSYPVSRETTQNGVSDHSVRPETSNTEKTHFTKVNIYDNKPQTRQTVRTEFSALYDDDVPETRQTTRTHISQDVRSDARPGSSKSVRSIPDSSFYAAKKQEKDPTARWESSFSRPSTAASNRVLSETAPVNGVSTVPHMLQTDDYKSSSAAQKTNQELVNENVYAHDSQPTYMPSEYIYGMKSEDKFDGRKMGLASNTFDTALAQMLEEKNQKMVIEQEEYDQFARQKPYKANPYLQTQPSFQRWEPPKPKKPHSPERQVTSMWREERGMERKMSPERRKSPERSWKPEYSTDQDAADNSAFDIWPHNRKTAAWGPEAKNTSIYGILGMKTPEKRERKPAPQKKKTKKTKRTLDQNLEAYDQKTLGQQEDDHFVVKETRLNKVKAVPEEEAENTFMSKVQVQRERVNKIRKACKSAEVIQRAWRRYVLKKKKKK